MLIEEFLKDLTPENQRKVLKFAEQLLNKQRAIVTVGSDSKEYATFRDALAELNANLVPGKDLVITDGTKTPHYLFRWHTAEEAKILTPSILKFAHYAHDGSGLWIEEEPHPL